jgi:hypothetical protein
MSRRQIKIPTALVTAMRLARQAAKEVGRSSGSGTMDKHAFINAMYHTDIWKVIAANDIYREFVDKAFLARYGLKDDEEDGTEHDESSDQLWFTDFEQMYLVRSPRSAPTVVALGDVGVVEGDQLLKQKDVSITRANNARSEFSRIWTMVRPLLVKNENWRWKDAIEFLHRSGNI